MRVCSSNDCQKNVSVEVNTDFYRNITYKTAKLWKQKQFIKFSVTIRQNSPWSLFLYHWFFEVFPKPQVSRQNKFHGCYTSVKTLISIERSSATNFWTWIAPTFSVIIITHKKLHSSCSIQRNMLEGRFNAVKLVTK